MKKLVLFTLISSTLLASSAFAAIGITVDGITLSSDVPPQIINGRTLVPVRAIFENLGANINWDDKTKTVTATTDSTTIKLVLNSNIAYVNDEHKTLDVPAQSINGRTMVPARFVAETLGCSVDWDANSQTVKITTSKYDLTEAPNIIFTTDATTNGLAETLMYSCGTVGSKKTYNNTEYFTLDTSNGKIAILNGDTAVNDWNSLSENNVAAVTFMYLGYSDVLDMPTGIFVGKYDLKDYISDTNASTSALTGEWKQINSLSKTDYQIAYIYDSTIDIYWVSEKDDIKALYWSGSYEAPKTNSNYSWISKNNTDKTNNALLASDDATKKFTYKDGTITYEATGLGTTAAIILQKNN